MTTTTRDLSTPPVIASGLLGNSPQPVLPAARGLFLRPWEPADAPAFLSAYQDAEIRRWHTRRPSSEAHVLEWFEAYRRDWAAERGGHWAIVRGEGSGCDGIGGIGGGDGDDGGDGIGGGDGDDGGGGHVLGRIATRGWDFDDGIAGMAYWVLPTARGAGVATSAVRALTAWAMEEVGFHRLHLDHSTRNPASCRVAEKAGYLLEGTKRSAALHDDGRHDMHLHARVRDI